MKMVEAYDDVDWARDGTKTFAAHTITVAYNGEEAELDVSEANYAEISARMTDLIRAGRKVTPRGEPAADNTRKRRGDSIKKAKAFRQWVQDNHIMREDDPAVIAYNTLAGNYSPPKWLLERYDEFLRVANGTALR